MRIEQLIKSSVLNLKPYKCAREEYKGEAIYLDANENPLGRYNRYPDPYQKNLKQEIAKQSGLNMDQIFIGNGSDEIIDLVIRLCCVAGQDNILQFVPTYGMYEVSAAINDIGVVSMPLDENYQIDQEYLDAYIRNPRTKVLFICSPINPIGSSISQESIEYVLEQFNGLVVIDEAYIDFSSEDSWRAKVGQYPNLLVMQTLSKAYGAAGLRIGMAYANEQLIKYLNLIKPPYNVSTPNQELALRILRNDQMVKQQNARILSEKKRISQAMKDLEVVESVYPSDANFLLVKVKDAESVYQRLLDFGIAVRNRDSQVKQCLRITIGTESENNLLLRSLKQMSYAEEGFIFG